MIGTTPRRGLLALVPAVLVVAACAVPVPVTPEAPELEVSSAVLPAQSERVIAETAAAFAAADEKADPALLGDRVGEQAAQLRAAQYKVEKAGGAEPAAIPSDFQAVYVTDAEDWPRFMAAVSRPEDPAQMPQVLLWRQEDSRSPYQLQAWSRMVPAAVLPAMPGQAQGTQRLSLDAEGLLLSPRRVIEAYVKFLNEGEDSEAASLFGADAYREALFSVRSSLNATAKKRGGTFKDTVTADLDDTVVLATAEGGALVFVPVEVVSAFVVPGAQLKLSKADAALLSGKVKGSAYYHYRDMLVISIPADGTNVPATVVAADHHLVSVTVAK